MNTPTENRRILIIDDDQSVLEAYRSIFSHPEREGSGPFEVTEMTQGQSGVAAVRNALEEESPYAVAFIDMRMPPGIDGKETARQIRQLDPDIYLVIVSAFSDYTPQEIHKESDYRLLFMRKPLAAAEIEHVAYSYCKSWDRDCRRSQLREQQETLLRQQKQLFDVFRSTAHTMKNSISYLGGIAERVAENQDHPEEIPKLLNPERMGMIQGQISMIKTMAQSALENARKSATQEERLPIREKIEEMVTLFSITSRGKGKPVELQLDDAFQSCISATPIDGQTLLLNLLNNAADAVDEYFSQLIEQGTSESFEQLTKLQQESMIGIHATSQEGRAEVIISNRGEPIADDIAAQIFEQGFSLKADGNGVGLYDVQQILQRIGGTIELRNGEQQVSFVLSLPTLNCNTEGTTA